VGEEGGDMNMRQWHDEEYKTKAILSNILLNHHPVYCKSLMKSLKTEPKDSGVRMPVGYS
jgi:hypothetical protein